MRERTTGMKFRPTRVRVVPSAEGPKATLPTGPIAGKPTIQHSLSAADRARLKRMVGPWQDHLVREGVDNAE